MRLFFRLLKEILWKPSWAVILTLLAIAGNIQVLLDFLDWAIGKDFSYFYEYPMVSAFSSTLSAYWIHIFLICVIFAITNGMFQKSRNYLGDRIIASRITLVSRDDSRKGDIYEKYTWIEINNEEEFDLRECYAALKILKIKSSDAWIPWDDIANENNSLLTFPEFQDKETIVHPGIPVRLNIAKTDGKSISLIFQRGDVPLNVQHAYPKLYVEIVVGGKDYGENNKVRKIEDKIFKGFLILESGIDDSYNTPTETSDTKVEIKNGAKITTTTKVEKIENIGRRYWYNLYLRNGELSSDDEG